MVNYTPGVLKLTAFKIQQLYNCENTRILAGGGDARCRSLQEVVSVKSSDSAKNGERSLINSVFFELDSQKRLKWQSIKNLHANYMFSNVIFDKNGNILEI